MLSPRLQLLKKAIQPHSHVGDIGTDHALLLCALARDPLWVESTLIGIEYQEGPLQQARSNLKRFGLEDRVELRLGYGFEPLQVDEVDTAVLSGLGGRTIVDIVLSAGEKSSSLSHLCVQPQRDIAMVRRSLLANGFSLWKEDMIKDRGQYYFCISFKPGVEKRSFSDLELKIGPLLLQEKHPLLCSFLLEREEKLRNIIENIYRVNPKSPALAQRQRELFGIKGALQCLYS